MTRYTWGYIKHMCDNASRVLGKPSWSSREAVCLRWVPMVSVWEASSPPAGSFIFVLLLDSPTVRPVLWRPTYLLVESLDSHPDSGTGRFSGVSAPTGKRGCGEGGRGREWGDDTGSFLSARSPFRDHCSSIIEAAQKTALLQEAVASGQWPDDDSIGLTVATLLITFFSS